MPAPAPVRTLRDLFETFASQSPVELPQFEVVRGEDMPQPYRDLLVHEHHMTVTLERFHGRPVELRIIAQRTDGSHYARMILLALEGTGEIVQFGIMRVDMRHTSPEVQAEIAAGVTPLGRILIEHDVLRRIDPSAYLRITPNRSLMNWFGIEQSQPLYGRIATIFCNALPAVELLEIVRPESPPK